MEGTTDTLTPSETNVSDGSVDGQTDRKSAEKYVYDALRKQGVKFADLTDEQRARALSAPEVHPGLRGKSVARFIIEGADLTVQINEATNERLVHEAEASHDRRSEAAKASGNTPPSPASRPRHNNFTDEERELIKRTQALVMNKKGEKYGNAISPLEVLTYRECIRNTPGFLAGVSKAEMKRISSGEERVPVALAKQYGHMYANLKPSWHWLKGIIAVAVADDYTPPSK